MIFLTKNYPSHLKRLVTVTERWILPGSHFNFTKGAALATAKAAHWWLMGALHFQTKRKQGGILQTQVWPEMTAGLNSCTSSLEYAAIYSGLSCFCRWEQCYVILGDSCLHTELWDWLNRKLFRQKRAAVWISYSGIHIRQLRLLLKGGFLNRRTDRGEAGRVGWMEMKDYSSCMCSCNHDRQQGFYLHSCRLPGSPADSRTTEGDWKTPATRGCPAHPGGAVEVCRASSALTSCPFSSATPLRTKPAAPRRLLQTLGKYWHTVLSNFTWATWFSVSLSDGGNKGVSSCVCLTNHLHLQSWETSICEQSSCYWPKTVYRYEKYMKLRTKGCTPPATLTAKEAERRWTQRPQNFSVHQIMFTSQAATAEAASPKPMIK